MSHRAAAVLTAVLAAATLGAAQAPGVPGGGGFGEFEPPAAPEAMKHIERLELISEYTHVTPGQAFWAAVVIEMKDRWHYYSPRPGSSDVFQPTPASLEVGEGLSLFEVRWAQHKNFEAFGQSNYGYEGRFVLFARLQAPQDAGPGELPIVVRLGGQICQNVCIQMEGVEASGAVTIADAAEANPAFEAYRDALADAVAPGELIGVAPAEEEPTPIAAAEDYTLLSGLLIAFLAGLALNIMPCVLPIIPLRIYALVELAGQSRRRYFLMGLYFAGGDVRSGCVSKRRRNAT